MPEVSKLLTGLLAARRRGRDGQMVADAIRSAHGRMDEVERTLLGPMGA
jgi:hypothetical protein